ncbi:MAG: tRNA-dihydrouridine synthase family protein [Desulfovibrionaceae bacterium]|nr:tRNA-dihydrouridine synthase family protein [Desulfovibrionaceae bacterium]
MSQTNLHLQPCCSIALQHRPAALPFRPESPWLAPLAGYTDLPFRLLCREYGAAVCCTEMVSAKGLMYHSTGTEDLLRTLPEDQPLVVQLFGSEPESLQRAMQPLLEQGFCWFDLNMGCSVPKVVRTGSGAAMMKDIQNSLAVAQAMVAMAGKGHVGFKFRLGWNEEQECYQELGLGLQEAGAGWVSLHPRYARQAFSGEARWADIAALVACLRIPVIASGDLFTAQDGVRCLKETGAATVMYARGAMNNPAIFAEHTRLWQASTQAQPAAHTPEEKLAAEQATRRHIRAMIQRHADLARAYSNERAALFKMRTFVPRYVHAVPGVRTLRQGLSACTQWPQLEALLDDFLGASN